MEKSWKLHNCEKLGFCQRSSTRVRDSIKRCWTWGQIRSVGFGPSLRRSRRTTRCSGVGWTGRFGREECHLPPAPALPTHMPLNKMGPQDDTEAFINLFERTVEACGWPHTNWPVRPIPLLSGEAQMAAQQLPVQNLLVYVDLKRAILQRVVMAQQLWGACRRWLMAGTLLVRCARGGRRDLKTAKTKFSMCWTWEQNSTIWGSSLRRICYRPRTGSAGCAIGEPDYTTFHREIMCLYYSQLLALNYSPSGKDP